MADQDNLRDRIEDTIESPYAESLGLPIEVRRIR